MTGNMSVLPRVLVVEDETILAMMLEEYLQGDGFDVVGPFGRLDHAMEAAEREALDVAVLDINIAGDMVFPVAEALDRRGVPLLLVTGYDDRIMRKAAKDWPRLMKPYRLDEVSARLVAMIGRG
jgi:DNA-binding response OmpR family regulator